MINDLSIKLVNVTADDNKFSIQFVAATLGDMSVMCYLLSLILIGKQTKFGPLDAKSIIEEFQEAYLRTFQKFPTISQWDMAFTIEVDYKEKKQSFQCDFVPEERNMDVELLCVNSDHMGMRIDFHARNEEQLENACYFIYLVLKGKGANQGYAYVNTIFQQFKEAFLEYKKQDIRYTIDNVSFLYGVLYHNGDQRFICYT